MKDKISGNIISFHMEWNRHNIPNTISCEMVMEDGRIINLTDTEGSMWFKFGNGKIRIDQ